MFHKYLVHRSFPSIHTTVAFAGATVFWGTPLGVFMLVCAIIVALSRVAVGVHFVSDIIVGALIGVTVTFMSIMTAGLITLIV
jgi:undecaprenyl-diphosphatase